MAYTNKEDRVAYNKQYYQKHKKEINARIKEKRKLCPGSRKEEHVKYYAKNKERLSLWHKGNYIKNTERILAVRRSYKLTQASKDAQAKSDVKSRNKFPEKIKARKITFWAIKSGKLLREPCEVCGSISKIHAHHEDYSEPLEVVWLCKKHHIERHKELQSQAKVKIVEIK